MPQVVIKNNLVILIKIASQAVSGFIDEFSNIGRLISQAKIDYNRYILTYCQGLLFARF